MRLEPTLREINWQTDVYEIAVPGYKINNTPMGCQEKEHRQIGDTMSAELDGFLGIINKLLAFLGSSGDGQQGQDPGQGQA